VDLGGRYWSLLENVHIQLAWLSKLRSRNHPRRESKIPG
jgi:hypothetical protein